MDYRYSIMVDIQYITLNDVQRRYTITDCRSMIINDRATIMDDNRYATVNEY